MSEGKKEILLGDCLELMKNIQNGSIDMILCDLPYGTTACKWDSVIPFEPLWEQYERIIKKGGAIVLTSSQPFTSALVMSNPKLFRYEWIWEKSKASNFLLAKKQPLKAHESILVFGNGSVVYYPQKVNGVPYVRGVRKNSLIEVVDYKTGSHNIESKDGLRFPRSVQKFTTAEFDGKFHPTQKPVALFEYLIKTYTNEGDLVLDNCAGSGTTAIACLNTKRQFIVMEKEQKYYDIILKRVGDFNKNFEPQTLFGNDAQLERLSDETMTPEKLKEEISKSKAISDIGKVVVESAKAEILYAKLTGKKEMNPTTFLEEPSRDPNIKALKDKYNNKEA